MCKLCEFTEEDKPTGGQEQNVIGVKLLDEDQYTGLYLKKYIDGTYCIAAVDHFEASIDINYCPECGTKL